MRITSNVAIVFAPLVMATACLFPGLGIAAEIVPAPKGLEIEYPEQPKPGMRVQVARPMVLKRSGLSNLLGYRWVLEQGIYKNPRQVIIEGKEMLILPVGNYSGENRAKVGGANLGDLGACYRPEGYYVVMDQRTGNILSKGLLRTIVSKPCREDIVFSWDDRIVQIIEQGDIQISWGKELVDADARAAYLEKERTLRVEEEKALTRKKLNDSTRSDKSKIGTRICRSEAGIQYIGFTEAVSPDNGKIQIRVADARLGSSRLGGFSPSIVWDNPDAWDLCD